MYHPMTRENRDDPRESKMDIRRGNWTYGGRSKLRQILVRQAPAQPSQPASQHSHANIILVNGAKNGHTARKMDVRREVQIDANISSTSPNPAKPTSQPSRVNITAKSAKRRYQAQNEDARLKAREPSAKQRNVQDTRRKRKIPRAKQEHRKRCTDAQ